MGLPTRRADESGNFMATCLTYPNCHWDILVPKEEFAVIMEVCHMVMKHPDEYKAMTGKDPDEVKFHYREYINACGRLL